MEASCDDIRKLERMWNITQAVPKSPMTASAFIIMACVFLFFIKWIYHDFGQTPDKSGVGKPAPLC
jgi:uncharacterized membrane protein